jgi:hypothetical protein
MFTIVALAHDMQQARLVDKKGVSMARRIIMALVMLALSGVLLRAATMTKELGITRRTESGIGFQHNQRHDPAGGRPATGNHEQGTRRLPPAWATKTRPEWARRLLGTAQSNQNQPHSIQPPQDPAEFLLDTCPYYGAGLGSNYNPDIAFDGTNYLIVWETGNSEGISAARVTPAGVVLDRDGIPLATCPYPAQTMNPSVAFDGANYFVVWAQGPSYDSLDVFGVRVSPAGQVLDSTAIPVCAAPYAQQYPVLAFGDSTYLVAWTDMRNPNSAVYGARVNRAGTVLDPNGIVIADTNPELGNPAGIAFDGTNFLVVWSARVDTFYDHAVFAARLSQTGTVLDPDGFRVSWQAGTQNPCAVAFGGAEYLVAWQIPYDSIAGLYCSFVAPNRAVRDSQGVVITRTCNGYGVTSTVFDGTNYFVTWDDYRRPDTMGRNDLYDARISPSGSVLDTGIAIVTSVGYSAEAAIGCDPSGFLVAFAYQTPSYYSDIEAIRVGHDGSVLDSAFVVSLSPNLQYYPAAAFDGANYLTVWLDYRRDGYCDIYGMRVSPAGALLDPESFLIARTSNNTGMTLPPAVGFDGSNYLVAWSDLTDVKGYLLACRVSPAGTVLDTTPISISSTDSTLKVWPVIAFDGSNYLVTWTDWPSSTPMQVYGARVTPAGSVLDPTGIPISVGAGTRGLASTVFGGANYLVAWIDERTGEDDIRGARVTPDGTVLDPDGIPISIISGSQWYPSVSFDGQNYLVTWSDNRSGSDFDLYAGRVTPAGTLLDPPGFPVCAEPLDQMLSSNVFDGMNHVVLFNTVEASYFSDIRGARVSPSGAVVDSFPVVIAPNDQYWPRIVLGPSRNVLLTYTGWTDEIQGKPCGMMRAWGKLGPFGGVAENPVSPGVARLSLEVRPNPMTDAALVNYSLSQPGDVTLRLYDVTGQLVSALVSGYRPAGSYSYSLLTTHYSLAAGVYLLREEAGNARVTLKLVIE